MPLINEIVAWFFAHLYLLIPILQVLTAAHVLITGRSWYWLWIIFCFPLLGTGVYFFVEIISRFPRLSTESFIDTILNAFLPGRQLKKLEKALEDADTVKNRKNLADYYQAAGDSSKAVELYRQCLSGIYKDDPHINLNLAYSLVESGGFAEAQKILEGLRKKNQVYETSKRDLTYARALEALGHEKEAVQIYEDIHKKYGSEVEGTCRLAQLLEKTGEKGTARSLYEDLLKKSKRFSPHYRREQKTWIKLSKERLKGILAVP